MDGNYIAYRNNGSKTRKHRVKNISRATHFTSIPITGSIFQGRFIKFINRASIIKNIYNQYKKIEFDNISNKKVIRY